jgi:hypothetical protein
LPDELLFHVEGSTASPRRRSRSPKPVFGSGSICRSGCSQTQRSSARICSSSRFEFDRWLPAAKSQSKVRDRLDALGNNTAGPLVVAELKRDPAPDTVEMVR